MNFEEWLNSPQGLLCCDTDILHFDSYEEIFTARLKAAFDAGAKSKEIDFNMQYISDVWQLIDGWQLVPKNLTANMYHATGFVESTPHELWNKLLSAAPKPFTHRFKDAMLEVNNENHKE